MKAEDGIDPKAIVKKATVKSMSEEFQSRQAKHIEEKEKKRRDAQEREFMKDARECDFKPMIAPRSKKLVAKARRKEAAMIVAAIQADAANNENGVTNNSETYIAALAGDVGARLNLVAKQQAKKVKECEERSDVPRRHGYVTSTSNADTLYIRSQLPTPPPSLTS